MKTHPNALADALQDCADDPRWQEHDEAAAHTLPAAAAELLRLHASNVGLLAAARAAVDAMSARRLEDGQFYNAKIPAPCAAELALIAAIAAAEGEP